MYKDFYDNYKGEKCKFTTFIYRIKQRGLTRTEAIKNIRLEYIKKPKTKITTRGRVCTKCGEYKIFNDFIKTKTKLGVNGICKECINKYKIKLRLSKEYKEQEKQYKKDFRQTEKGKIRTKLDNIYYSDKQIIKNRSIIKKIRDITRKEAKQSKIEYFLNKGYNIEFLKNIY